MYKTQQRRSVDADGRLKKKKAEDRPKTTDDDVHCDDDALDIYL